MVYIARISAFNYYRVDISLTYADIDRVDITWTSGDIYWANISRTSDEIL
jgi:hypothetical protein